MTLEKQRKHHQKALRKQTRMRRRRTRQTQVKRPVGRPRKNVARDLYCLT